MAKESLFNILTNYFDFEQVVALDLFTGTGNISYELVSRGCREVTALDIDSSCIKFVRQTATSLAYSEILVIQSDYSTFLNRSSNAWDLIFADPPYSLENAIQIPHLVFSNNLLKDRGWLVIEHDKHIDYSHHPAFFDHRRYGKVNFSFFRERKGE